MSLVNSFYWDPNREELVPSLVEEGAHSSLFWIPQRKGIPIEVQVVSKEKNTEITFSRLKSMQIYIIK